MVRKLKGSGSLRPAAKKAAVYRSLSEGPSAKARLQQVLKRIRGAGVTPFTVEGFDHFMQEPSSWPEEESIDSFVAWRRQTRKEPR